MYGNVSILPSRQIQIALQSVDGVEKHYLLTVTRKKRPDGSERLRLRAELYVGGQKDGQNGGEIEVNPMFLAEELPRLYSIGVSMGKYDLANLIALCKTRIHEFHIEPDTDVRDAILNLFRRELQEREIPLRKISGRQLYCLPLEQFNQIAEESDFRMTATELKRFLKNGGYVITNTNCLHYTVAVPNTRKRLQCIAFLAPALA